MLPRQRIIRFSVTVIIVAGIAGAIVAAPSSATPEPLARATASARENAAQQAFSVADALSYSFPTSLVASADGNTIAWVLNEQGARNIWVAEAPDFAGRRLTAYEGDDGQAISNLQFAHGGRQLIYVRGGSPNRAGELPNPMSYADGVAREIWAIDVDGGEPVRLAEGSTPLVSPAGTEMVFAGRGMQHMELPAPGADVDPEALESRSVMSPRGGVGGVRWSPDGNRLLFVSNRGTHSYIGVVDLDGGPITWIDPSVDSDTAAVWSPDGSQVAFVRVPARRELIIFAPNREASPWSIRIADVATATSEVVFTADDGPGSVPTGFGAGSGPHTSGGLIWAAGDRLVFPWERNGWIGVYSIPATGGEPTQLAVGDFEVELVAHTADRGKLLLTSNQDDIDRRHVWEVPVDGSGGVRLTRGDEIEWGAVPLQDGGIAYLRSNATTPAHVVVQPQDAEPRVVAAESIPTGYPSDRMVRTEQVVFPGADGLLIHGQLFLPDDIQPGEQRPAVLFFHGGSRRQMLLGFHYLEYYHHSYALNQALAARGYVVLSVNYRSGIGYGLEFREALDYGATGASEFNDVLGAGLYLRGRDDVDPERIGLWGGSYGGYLTAMGLARASDLFAAGVDIHGVHDWNDGIRIFVPSYDPDEATERLAFESSPNASLDTWRSPVLLIHGDDDRNVFFSQTVYLVEELRNRGVHVEQLVFPDEVHGFLLHRNWVRAYEATVDFFDRMLRAQ